MLVNVYQMVVTCIRRVSLSRPTWRITITVIGRAKDKAKGNRGAEMSLSNTPEVGNYVIVTFIYCRV
jgi:hypothetical protein